MDESKDTGAQELATQGGITFIGNLFRKLLGFIFVTASTRLVTPSQYGIFTLSLSVVLFTQGFASLNIYRSVDYFVPQFLNNDNYGKAKKTLQNTFLIGIGASILGSLILFLLREQIAAAFGVPEISTILPYLALLIPLQTILRTFISIFNSMKIMKYRVIINDILNPLIRTLGAVILITLGGGVLGLVGGYLLGATFAILCGFAFFVYEAEWIRSTESSSVSNQELLSYSLPLVLAGVIYSLVGQMDYFAIGFFLNSEDVGKYRVAYLLTGNLLIVLTAVTPVFKPMIAENKSDTAELRDLYQLATRWITMLTLPLAVTLIIAPDTYLSLLFTKEYSTSAFAVVALSLGYLFNASFGPEGMVLEGLGHTRLTLINTFVLVTVNGVLNVLLIPYFGTLGAGIATGTALTLTGLIGVIEIYILRSIHPLTAPLASIWLAILPSVILGKVVSELNEGQLATAIMLPIVIGGTYLITLRVIKAFTPTDIETASQIDDSIGYPVLQSLTGFTRNE
jgi:O-antigen/teichoic acid export membrane protein